MPRVVFACVLALSVLAEVASAQTKDPYRGPFIQAGVEGHMHSSDAGEFYGAGVAARLGYGVTASISLAGDINRAFLSEDGSSFELDQFQAVVRATSPKGRIAPYVEVGGGRQVIAKSDVEICVTTCATFDFRQSGPIFTLGTGASVATSSRLSADVGVRWSLGEFSKFTVNGTRSNEPSHRTNTLRLHVGVRAKLD